MKLIATNNPRQTGNCRKMFSGQRSRSIRNAVFAIEASFVSTVWRRGSVVQCLIIRTSVFSSSLQFDCHSVSRQNRLSNAC